MSKTLILLVGENPLPNYIVAKFLSKVEHKDEQLKPTQILLVTTNQMEKVASRLGALLKKECGLACKQLPWDSKISYQGLAAAFLQNAPDTTFLHLNYTGGTKQMATCAIRALSSAKSSQPGIKIEASYLEASSHSLRFEISTEDIFDLRRRTSLSLSEMLALHGYTSPDYLPITPNPNYTKYGKIIERLRQLASEEEPGGRQAFCRFQQWRTRQLISAPSTRILATAGWLYEESLPDILQIVLSEVVSKTDTWEQQPELKKLLLDGDWLLQAVLERFQVVLRQPLALTVTDQAAELIVSKVRHDLVLIQGYQLTVINCAAIGCETGTELRKRLRGRALETAYYARQLGGEEARAILITLASHDEVQQVTNELSSEDENSLRLPSIQYYQILQGEHLRLALRDN